MLKIKIEYIEDILNDCFNSKQYKEIKDIEKGLPTIMLMKIDDEIIKEFKRYVMITEDYCSFEISKLLKEKGFNERTNCSYVVNNYNCPDRKIGERVSVYAYDDNLISCPTHQIAMKWLREIKHWFIKIEYLEDSKSYIFVALQMVYENCKQSCFSENYNTYEDAVDAAIVYCLENIE